MSTHASRSSPRRQHAVGRPARSRGSASPSGATLPVPGNAEFLVYAVVDDRLRDHLDRRATASTRGTVVRLHVVLTFVYILSRGIAKASRVLEQ